MGRLDHRVCRLEATRAGGVLVLCRDDDGRVLVPVAGGWRAATDAEASGAAGCTVILDATDWRL